MKKRVILTAAIVLLCAVCAGVAACANMDRLPDWAFNELREQDNSRAEGSDVRAMSVNVLVHMESWGGEPVYPRALMMEQFTRHYAPDVIALQEMCSDWYKYFPELVEDTYALVHDKSIKTNLMYDKTKLTLIDGGVEKYSKRDTSGCRAVAWGVFEIKESGKRFAATSTHFDLGTDEKKVEYRTTQIAELAERINSIIEQYDVPVIAMGDYNVLVDEDYGAGSNYSDLIKVTGTKDAHLDFLGSIEKAYDEEYVQAHKDWLWDHILIKGDVTPLKFYIVTSPFFDCENPADSMTDHYPHILDAQL